MTEVENEKAWEVWYSYGKAKQARLIEACYQSALYLKARVEQDGWRWSDNYMREHARCVTKPKLEFSNTISPVLYQLMRAAHPDITFRNDDLVDRADMFAAPAPKPPAPLPPTNARLDAKGRLIHNRCAVCWSPDAPFGSDVAVKDGVLGMWYCKDHWTPTSQS